MTRSPPRPQAPRREPLRSRGLGALAGLALSFLGSGTAHAQHTWAADVGAYVSYDFGGRRPGHFGFGLELRATYADQQLSCGAGASPYAGVAARLSVLGSDQIRVLVAPQLGLSVAFPYPYPPITGAFGGELGLGYRMGRDRGAFLQPGLEASFVNVVFLRVDNAFARAADTRAFEHSSSVDLGARLTPAASHDLSASSCD